MSEDDLLTITEAVEAFDVPRIKLYRWMQAGRLPAYRHGRDERVRLVRRADVEALLRPTPIRPEEALEGKSAA